MASKESNRGELLLLPLLAMFFGSSFGAIDTIRPKDLLTSNDNLVSEAGVFELGFFNDVASGIYYLGIWFKADPNRRAIWVSRENPMIDSSCTLQIRYDGNLVMIDRRQTPMIVNSGMLATNANTSATLLDSGNFVLKQGGAVIWQSFDYPTDTFLPGMKVGWFGLHTDQSRRQVLVAWVTPQNPARGSFTLGVDYSGSTKLSVWREDNVDMDIGFWDRGSFRFIFANTSDRYNFSYVSNENETYFSFNSKGTDASTWFVMASTGQLEEYNMVDADGGKRKKLRLIVAAALASLSVLILILLSYVLWIRHKKKLGSKVRTGEETSESLETTLVRIGVGAPDKDLASAKKAEISQQKDQDLALFTFSSIEVATDYFAQRNKLGEGGFGPVYKGQLPEGLEIAVKRLSKMSRQGLEEFKNEVNLISKLQHRNLVRLLGCCIEGEESILIYEYMPNKSLDSFIFGSCFSFSVCDLFVASYGKWNASCRHFLCSCHY
ncbi:hypothetical protein BT93_C1840 [Corymbia citriodora subsp. variegata]|nr:hypothetical protein BT93_C1840 [Corymbia citriodora subsp. variegata]